MARIDLNLIALAFLASPGLVSADQVDYLLDVKSLLEKHCTRCHGADKKESGLRLDSATSVIEGGNTGPAIVPGKPDESLLVKAVTGADESVTKMPPEGPPLAGEQIALLHRWIAQGASTSASEDAIDKPSAHWAFQRPERPQLPSIKHGRWSNNPIDCFVLARLEASQLGPSPPAERPTLIRRVTLDLLGLPPSVNEVNDFLRDTRVDAYERLVDRLLASPFYGERWGRHWLDLARYADSNGFTRDFGRQMFRYRDWVIDAVNRDLAFNQFTIEQIAGDLLPDAGQDQIIATGFHRNTLINEEGGTDAEQFRVDAVADRVATTGAVFLGLTLGCARCHEHKYDPISQREYYEMFAFLNNCDEPEVEVPYHWQVEEGYVKRRDEIRQQIANLERRLAERQTEFDALQLQWEKSVTPEQRAKLPGPTQEALMKSLTQRDDPQKKLVADVFTQTDIASKAFPEVERIVKLRASEPLIPTALVMKQRKESRETYIHRRGNFLDTGRRVAPAVPAVLHRLPAGRPEPNRMDFARWLAAEDNPLTPRVVMNRTWQRLFGRGIVETENDFGVQGSPPSHPQLLDWLATEFIGHWSMKRMHRAIALSATYRQSSRIDQNLLQADPGNRLFARQSRLRLEAECVRDNALSVSQLLTLKIGGPSVFPPQPDGVFEFTQDPKPWNTEAGEDRFRRGMYTHFWRSSPYPSLMVFDFPDSNVTCTRRVRSNTPLQSLTLANDIQFVECARALAERVLREASRDTLSRVGFIFQACLARDPSPIERDLLLSMIDKQHATFQGNLNSAKELVGRNDVDHTDVAELATWTAVARVMINLDEFITRE